MWTSFTLASVYSVDEKIPQSIYKQCLLIVLEAIFSYLSTRISGLCKEKVSLADKQVIGLIQMTVHYSCMELHGISPLN